MKFSINFAAMLNLVRQIKFALNRNPSLELLDTRDVFYVRRKVDLMKTTKVNAYIMHIF